MLKKLLRNLDLNIKINFLIVSVTALILIALGITIYFTQSVILKNNIDSQIGFYIHNFDYLLQKKSQENSVNSKLVADYIFQINEESGKTMLFSKDTLSIYIRERVSLKEEELIVELDKYCNITNLESKGLMLSVLYKSGMRRGCNGQNVESIAETKIFSKIKYINDNTIHTVYYQWPENQNAEKHIMYLKYFSNYNAFLVISAPENFLFKSLYQLRNIIIISILISIVLLIIILNFIIRPLSANLHEIAGVVTEMSKGKDVGIIDIDSNDEIGKISTSINSLIIGTKELNNFSNELKTGNYNSVFKPLSEQDLLGNSLLEMRESLKKAELEREMQAISEEQRNWANMGLANFADILRKNDSNISDLSFYVISELVKYVDAVMGGIFILNDEDNNNIYLELTGCFAYDRRKYLVRKLIPGEGLVGSCFLEKQNIYLTDIPEGYLEIVSGLGDTNPPAKS